MRTKDILKGKPVTIDLWDRESLCAEKVGGGVETGNPAMVAILLDIDSDWVTYKWKHSGQIVIVPVRDVLCIASDLSPEGGL